MSGQFQLVTPTHTTMVIKRGIITEVVLETKDTVELEKYITLSVCVLTLKLQSGHCLKLFLLLFLNQVPA